MYIILRHADDSVIDLTQQTYKHDTTITNNGKRRAYKLAKRLVRKYGVPDVIYCSPFQRGRDTVQEMLKVFSSDQLKNIKILVDLNLTKYFTESQKVNPKIHSSTSQYNIPFNETKEQVMVRANNHLNRLARHHPKPEITWSVTHAIMVKYIGRIKGDYMSDSIDFLEYITV